MAKDSYKIENEAFLVEVAKDPEVKALPKGIFYKVLATGDGKSAQTAAVVSVYYRGSLIDG
jgi:peptidylprolyl isomerase